VIWLSDVFLGIFNLSRGLDAIKMNFIAFAKQQIPAAKSFISHSVKLTEGNLS
jgi:hypothetical protein